MAEIKDCTGKNIKVGKTSITIKNEDGKTCGVVRDISTFHDLQPNKQIDFWKTIRALGLNGKLDKKQLIISDGKLYVLRNMKSVLFYEKYGYFSDEEKDREKQKEEMFKNCREHGIEVIECIFV